MKDQFKKLLHTYYRQAHHIGLSANCGDLNSYLDQIRETERMILDLVEKLIGDKK